MFRLSDCPLPLFRRQLSDVPIESDVERRYLEHDRAKGVPLNTGAILVKLRDFGPAAALLLVVPILSGIKKNAIAAKADRFLSLDCSSSCELAWRPFRATISL